MTSKRDAGTASKPAAGQEDAAELAAGRTCAAKLREAAEYAERAEPLPAEIVQFLALLAADQKPLTKRGRKAGSLTPGSSSDRGEQLTLTYEARRRKGDSSTKALRLARERHGVVARSDSTMYAAMKPYRKKARESLDATDASVKGLDSDMRKALDVINGVVSNLPEPVRRVLDPVTEALNRAVVQARHAVDDPTKESIRLARAANKDAAEGIERLQPSLSMPAKKGR